MAQRKFIVIAESWLEILFKHISNDNGSESLRAVDSYPGGALLNLAKTLASNSLPTMLLTEIGNDAPGNEIAANVAATGVDLSCADRYSVVTPVALRFPDRVERYDIPGTSDGFDIAWPRVEEEDVVVFGGFPAVDERIHDRLWQFLANCKERKATIVYVPLVDDERLRQITLVMPRIFESFEIADVVVTLPGDLSRLYGHEDADRAYRDKIAFYCPRVVSIVGAENPRVYAFGNVPTSDRNEIAPILSDILTHLPLPDPAPKR